MSPVIHILQTQELIIVMLFSMIHRINQRWFSWVRDCNLHVVWHIIHTVSVSRSASCVFNVPIDSRKHGYAIFYNSSIEYWYLPLHLTTYSLLSDMITTCGNYASGFGTRSVKYTKQNIPISRLPSRNMRRHSVHSDCHSNKFVHLSDFNMHKWMHRHNLAFTFLYLIVRVLVLLENSSKELATVRNLLAKFTNVAT
jgi:hypothetical protein